MIEYECKKCGCKNVYAIPNGRRMGVYCADCNEWICWTTYKNMVEIYKNIDESKLNDSVAMRRIYKRSGLTTMRCSKCNCLLYNSSNTGIKGQFNLVNAKYCPNCGRKLI